MNKFYAYTQKVAFLALFAIGFVNIAFSQNNVGIGTETPNPRALLELQANDKGFLVPRLTTAQRTAIAVVAGDRGLLVFDTDEAIFYFYDGTTWQPLSRDLFVGNEVANVVPNCGLVRLGAGTSADPYIIGLIRGGGEGHVLSWDATNEAWVSTPFSATEIDGVVGNEISGLVNPADALVITGNGTELSPFRIGLKPGRPGEVLTWDGTVWASRPITSSGSLPGGKTGDYLTWDETTNSWVPGRLPTFTEKDSIVGNEITNVINANDILIRQGNGTTTPFTIGMKPGTAANQVLTWDNTNRVWVPGTVNSLPNGTRPGDVLTWDGTNWISSPEVDGVIGNEVLNATPRRGLVRSGSGTQNEPFTLGLIAGTNVNDVLSWNGTEWVSAPIGSGGGPVTEEDGTIGNEVTDVIPNQGLRRTGTGNTADPFPSWSNRR